MNLRRVLDHMFDVFFLILILVGTLLAINYFESEGVFDAKISYVNNIKPPYSIILNLENKVDEKLEYNVEILYKRDNLVVSSSTITCKGKCEEKLVLSKVFFDTYEVIVRTKYNGRFYQKKLSFSLDKPPASFDVNMDSNIYYDSKSSLKIKGSILSAGVDRIYIAEITPKNRSEFKQTYQIECSSNPCEFNLEFSKQIVFGDYEMNFYSQTDNLQKKFKVIFKEEYNMNHYFATNNKKILYDSKGRLVDAKIKLTDSTKKLGKKDLEFEFSSGSVKSIKVAGVDPSQVSIGYEVVPIEKVKLLNTISSVFAIDPHVPDDVEEIEVTFVATGIALLKCADYNFTTQTCYGSYEKILETIPGQTYTFTMTPKDPQFVNIDNYLMSPIRAQCQYLGDGTAWSSANCDDTSYSGYSTCDSNAEYTFCDDDLIESHSLTRNAGSNNAGVRMFFSDTSQSNCQNVKKVEVIYKTWFQSDITKGTQYLRITKNNGSSWTDLTFTKDTAEPASNREIDVTSLMSGGWNCSNFFSSTSGAGIEASWLSMSGGPNIVHNIFVDTLIFRVSYNYSVDALSTDKASYIQSEIVKIQGSQIWNSLANVSINVTRNDSTIAVLGKKLVNSSGYFDINYSIGDYGSVGRYTIYASQDNDTTKNASQTFTVTKRNPTAFMDRTYYSIGQKIIFTGNNFNRSGIINITKKDSYGSIVKNTTTTTQTGSFSYNWTIPIDYLIPTGVYTFNFSEKLDPSYNSFLNPRLIFRPFSSSSDFSKINQSDNILYNLGGLNGAQYFYVNFSTVMSGTDYELNTYNVYVQHNTVGSTTRTIDVWNTTTLVWNQMCIVPDSATKVDYKCDITSRVNKANPNDVRLRLTEGGNSAVHWYIDLIYVMRNVSSKGPIVNLIQPTNNTWYKESKLYNLTYTATNPQYSMDSCSLYINNIFNQSNSTPIVNSVYTNFTLTNPLSEGLHKWKVSCIGDILGNPVGNSTINDLYIDLTKPKINLTYPQNNSFIEQKVYLAANFSDNLGLKNATLRIYNLTNSLIGTNSTTISTTFAQANLSYLLPYDGIFHWNYIAFDKAGNFNVSNTNLTIIYDITKPKINLSNPLNETALIAGRHNFSANFSDNMGLKNATLLIWNSTGSLIATNQTLISGLFNSTNLSYNLTEQGFYYWNYLVYDQSKNYNTSSYNFTFSIDSSVPNINFVPITDNNDTWVNRSWTFINVTVDDFSLNETWLEWMGINFSMSCNSITQTQDNCFLNKTKIKNGDYTFRVCSEDKLYQQNCTQIRTIHINKTLSQINIISPLNNVYYYSYDEIYFNITTTYIENFSWYELNQGVFDDNLSKISTYAWSQFNSNLNKGRYNVTFFVGDDAGNMVNKTTNFTIILGKYVYVTKYINNSNTNQYKITLNVTNKGTWQNYTLIDFVESNFTYSGFNINPNSTRSFSGFYSGEMLRWNLTLSPKSSKIISYNLTSANDFQLMHNFICSID